MDDTADLLSIDTRDWHDTSPSSSIHETRGPDLLEALHRVLQTTLAAWEIETCRCPPDGAALRFDSGDRRTERRERPEPAREIRRRDIAAAWHHNQR